MLFHILDILLFLRDIQVSDCMENYFGRLHLICNRFFDFGNNKKTKSISSTHVGKGMHKCINNLEYLHNMFLSNCGGGLQHCGHEFNLLKVRTED